MDEFNCRVCGKLVMSEKYCLKTEDRVLRFCCQRCKERYQEKPGPEIKPVSPG